MDSLPDIAESVNRMLADIAIPPLDHTTVRRFVGNGLPKLVERVIVHCDIEIARHGELTQTTLRHYNEVSCDRTVLYPGVADALSRLRDQEHRLGLCTNKPEAPARHVLQQLGISGYFDAVTGGDTLTVRKPDPAHLLATFDALGASDERVFVGDSEVDAETARRAKIPFLLFTEGYRKSPLSDLPHDRAYGDSSDLPGLVQQVLNLGATSGNAD